jgi:hypothetical protein
MGVHRRGSLRREESSTVQPWAIIKAATAVAFPGGPCERLVFLALWRHADEEATCWPSLARLAKLTGFSRRRVQEALHRLQAADFLGWTALNGRSNFYTLSAEAVLVLVAQGESPEPTHDVPGSPFEQAAHDEKPEPTHDVPGSNAPPTQPVPGLDDKAADPCTTCPPPGTTCPPPVHHVPTK